MLYFDFLCFIGLNKELRWWW